MTLSMVIYGDNSYCAIGDFFFVAVTQVAAGINHRVALDILTLGLMEIGSVASLKFLALPHWSLC